MMNPWCLGGNRRYGPFWYLLYVFLFKFPGLPYRQCHLWEISSEVLKKPILYEGGNTTRYNWAILNSKIRTVFVWRMYELWMFGHAFESLDRASKIFRHIEQTRYYYHRELLLKGFWRWFYFMFNGFQATGGLTFVHGQECFTLF